MATNKEDYVSFETAKLLKDKGFDEPCRTFYKGKELINDVCTQYYQWNSKSAFGLISAPTHQMAMKWLRETHNIDVVIDAAVGMLGVKVYIPFISTYNPLEGAPSKVRQLKRGIYYKDDKGVIPALQHFDSYEETVEAALKYCLEKKLP